MTLDRSLLPDRTPDPAIAGRLVRNARGAFYGTSDNVIKAIGDDPRWGLRTNLMGRRIELNGKEFPEDAGSVLTQEYLADTYGLRAAVAVVATAVKAVASSSTYHPVREYLDGLTWDGETRIARLAAVLACADDSLNLRFLRCAVLSAAARALWPGCQVDSALILVGPQGVGKSSFFRELFGANWFSDSPIPVGDKDAFLQLALVWACEVAEMESIRKADVETVRQLVTSRVDTYRAPYDRAAQQYPRHAVLCGTTNRRQFLTDPAGSRRFHPVEAGRSRDIDVVWVRENRDQLWAEVVHALRAGEEWRLTREEDSLREARAERFSLVDDWKDAILAAATDLHAAKAARRVVKTFDIVRRAFGWKHEWQDEKLDRRTSLRVADILHAAGWELDDWVRDEAGVAHRGWAPVPARPELRLVADGTAT